MYKYVNMKIFLFRHVINFDNDLTECNVNCNLTYKNGAWFDFKRKITVPAENSIITRWEKNVSKQFWSSEWHCPCLYFSVNVHVLNSVITVWMYCTHRTPQIVLGWLHTMIVDQSASPTGSESAQTGLQRYRKWLFHGDANWDGESPWNPMPLRCCVWDNNIGLCFWHPHANPD